ncbi:acyl-CoA dehydrogenase family protein [Ancrocorticia sp.]|uniref:acyl-CoA dehydrogenase family protein n=1 Tax=Ancrocorticia sp. TaxID=2593684 RepID=UPI003F91082E
MTTQHNPVEFQPLGADYLGYAEGLTEEEKSSLMAIRDVMETHVRPIANDYWDRAEFPHHVVPEIGRLGIMGDPYPETARFENSAVYRGFSVLELGRVSAGITTLVGVSSGLCMGAIQMLGSEEQKRQWLGPLARAEKVGAFGLTEPQSGSDAARGLLTVAQRTDSGWVINGEKRWIGNATWGDVVVINARDDSDGKVKAFIVPTDTPGYAATKIENKYSQRDVQNADIVMTDMELPAKAHLPGSNGFADIAKVLTRTRIDVAWGALGTAVGAYEAALDYAKKREQFGRPIASFQLIQNLLVKSLREINACLGMCVQVSRSADRIGHHEQKSALAKAHVTASARQVVAWCREIFGGNGIDLDYNIIRYFNDLEAQYSFEGTLQMNTLIVGRDITGHSAFV